MNFSEESFKQKVYEFYLIWNPNGRAPTYKHYNPETAKREAERLALANPGQTFIVLKSVAECSVNVQPSSWTTHEKKPPF